VPRRLTDSEVRILELVAHGNTDKQVSEELGISPLTARTHMYNIERKLNVHTRAHAVYVGMCRGLIR